MTERATLKTPEGFFDNWLLARADPQRDPERPSDDRPLTAASARPYRLVWLSWCRWLTEKGDGAKPRAAHWSAATARDLNEFLDNGPSPKSARRGRATPITDITRRRYWRILQRLYQHALDKQLVAANPADATQFRAPKQEVGNSEVLNPKVWEAIKTLSWPVAHWSDLRDLAIWGLLVEKALTPQEIIHLGIGIEGGKDSLRPHRDGSVTVAIEVPDSRVHQAREFVATGALAQALLAWKAKRSKLGATAGAKTRLFLSMRGGPMTHRNLFHLAAGKIAAAYKIAAPGDALSAHIGPLALRTTWLYHRLREGVDPAQLAREAGLKDPRSLRRLAARLRDDAGAHGAAIALKPSPRIKNPRRA